MRYVIHGKWSLTEHFVITDQSGTPAFDVHGNLGIGHRLSFRDQSGHELAQIKKHLLTTKHEILADGKSVAEVHHTGLIGDHYEIDSSFGRLTAKGHFAGWDYSISHQGRKIAKVSRELALRERFGVEIDKGLSDVFILAVVLAIDEIHEERREKEHR